MNKSELMKVLLSPRITEKTSMQYGAANVVSFKVVSSANKQAIKQAVELMFEVKVADVRTVNVKGKKRRFGRIEGQTKGWKKAYVTLAEGHDIQFAEGEMA